MSHSSWCQSSLADDNQPLDLPPGQATLFKLYAWPTLQEACQVVKECLPRVGKIPWKRAWQPTPVFLPEKFPEQRSLVGYSPWGRTEPDMTEC